MVRTGQKTAAFLIFSMLSVGAVSAVAEEGAPGEASSHADESHSADGHSEMLRLSARGHELYEAGQIAEAADVYAQAFAAYPQAILLKNEMVARYLLEDCETSIKLGRTYLETGEAGSEDVQDVETVFAECALDLAEAALDAYDKELARQWLEFGDEYFDEVLAGDAAKLRVRLREMPDRDPNGSQLADTSMEPLHIAGWSAIGLGAVTVAGAAIWHVQALNQYNELELGVTDRRRFDHLQESVSRARWAVPTLYTVGGVALLAGTGLLLFTPVGAAADEGSLSLTPVFGPDHTGVSFTGRF